LMKKLHVPMGAEKTFRYLTLPGEDMLDVRSLGSIAAQKGFRLHYLAFNGAGKNSKEERILTLSQHHILSQDWADVSSKIVWQRLENVAAAEKSDAFVSAVRHGPYHAINLDLCDSIACKNLRSGNPCGLDALAKIFQLQTDYCSHDWLLFVATRVLSSEVNLDYLNSFLSSIKSNIESSDEFRAAFEGLFKRSNLSSDDVLSAPERLPSPVFLELFCVGFSKWLLRLLGEASPRWQLKMLKSYCYSVYGGEPDMLSLVYKVERVVKHTSTPPGMLYGQLSAARPEEEPVLARCIVERTAALLDLDAKLASDPQLFSSLAGETEALLREASYDVSTYLEWAKNELIV